MNAVTAQTDAPPVPALGRGAPARIALLGVGTVGSALLRRLADRQAPGLAERLSLVYVANSQVAVRSPALQLPPQCTHGSRFVEHLATCHGPVRSDPGNVATVLGERGTRILIDATASEVIADHHAVWLAQGIHVVTACKLAQGTSLPGWHAVQAGRQRGGSQYGDSATVGAGLPLLRTIRELRAGGDRIHAMAGVLSGSLAWLFNRYDGTQPFSDCVRTARAAGYTEPDPREDLSGEDVRRKTLILARAAGLHLEPADVDVASLVTPALAGLPVDAVDAALGILDEPLRARFAEASGHGDVLRFISRVDFDPAQAGHGRARVGLQALTADHPLAGGAGTDNRLAIWSDRYRDRPLVIQGPGAGAEVTAAALLDDALRIAASG